MFGVPYEYYEKYGIRRYGFHGTSHRYVSNRCYELLGKPGGEGTKIITCHLGNGSSIAAIKDGKVIDTTMGLTPLDGFIMGTRSGAVDPLRGALHHGAGEPDAPTDERYSEQEVGYAGYLRCIQ